MVETRRPAMVQPGDRIGDRYTVERFAGRGTYSEVYRGLEDTGRPVALKLLRGTDERQRREASAVAQLVHPNIVTTFAVLQHEGALWLVQEWIDGESLEGILERRRRLDLHETLMLAADVAAALVAAHGRGILHRDLKPSNMPFERAGRRYKLVDFGAVSAPGTSATGTPSPRRSRSWAASPGWPARSARS